MIFFEEKKRKDRNSFIYHAVIIFFLNIIAISNF